MNNRIRINKENGEVVIAAIHDKQKQLLLNAWVVLWTLCGAAIFTQFFLPDQEGLTTYLLVMLAFWMYFEYKAIIAFRWRKWGTETLRFIGNEMELLVEIKGRGIPRRFNCEQIRKIRLLPEISNNLVKIMGQSYWNPGHERIIFDYGGRDILFGKELTESEAKKILVHVQQQLKKKTVL